MTWIRSHKGIVGSVVGFLVGITIGAGGSSSTTTETQVQTREHTTTEVRTQTLSADERSELRDLRDRVAARRGTLRQLERKITGARGTIAKSTFDGDGTYVVGEDVAPGTYRAAATPGCYWARLSSLDTGDIIDNDNANGPVVLEILPSDKAIQVTRCGTFHRSG